MNREAVEAWVAALRSGDYEQARGALCALDSDSGAVVGYCCLGVACEVYAKTHDDLSIDDDYEAGYRGYDVCTGYLPAKVRSWLTGSTDDDRKLLDQNMLAEMNDKPTSTFDIIANVIEKNYLKKKVN